MKNKNLKSALAKFNAMNDLQPLEGEIIGAIKGGVSAPCKTKCGSNSQCNSNDVLEPEE